MCCCCRRCGKQEEEVRPSLLRQSLLGGAEMMPAAKLANVDAAARWARAQAATQQQLPPSPGGSALGDHRSGVCSASPAGPGVGPESDGREGGSDSSKHYRRVTSMPVFSHACLASTLLMEHVLMTCACVCVWMWQPKGAAGDLLVMFHNEHVHELRPRDWVREAVASPS
jgi:hypothetical protein